MQPNHEREPYIDGHVRGDSAWVDMIWVPEPLRGAGHGRRLYEEFEASLPERVRMVHVFAADTDGSGNSDGFWDALGFAYRFEADAVEDLGYESRHRMIKGVNGHPTPKAIRVDPEEE